MMEALRNGAKTWVAKVLLGLVMRRSLQFWVCPAWTCRPPFKALFRQDLATVGGRALSSETYRQELNRTIQQFGQQTGNNITLEDATQARPRQAGAGPHDFADCP